MKINKNKFQSVEKKMTKKENQKGFKISQEKGLENFAISKAT